MTIGVTHVGDAQHMTNTLAIKRDSFNKNILCLALISAAIHAPRTADGTGTAAIQLKTCNARLLRDTRHGNIERRRACTNAMTANRLDTPEAAPEAADKAPNAAIPPPQVPADP